MISPKEATIIWVFQNSHTSILVFVRPISAEYEA